MKKEPAKGFRLVFGYLGLFLAFEGIVTLFPLLTLIFYPGEWKVLLDFIVPAVIDIAVGILLYKLLVAGREKLRFRPKEDAVLLVLIWIGAILSGAMPFFLTRFSWLNFGDASANLDMSFSECFFEATSGFTTTGLTLFPKSAYLDGVASSPLGVDSCSAYGYSHVFLFHRAFMQFIGGVGLVLLLTSIIASRQNFKLYFAEGHNDQIVPNLAKSAKIIFLVYAGWVAAGSLGLWLAGMPPFEAVCTSMSCLGTGGFSTRAESIYFFCQQMPLGEINNLSYTVTNSLGIEIITCVLMLAGATSLVLHTFALRGKLKDFFCDIEIVLTGALLVVGILICSLSMTYLYNEGEGLDFLSSLRYGTYFTITSLTTSGFANFPSLLKLGPVCFFLGWVFMTIGGGMGSTAGGIKQYRVGILGKEFYWFLRYHDTSDRTISPHVIRRLGIVKEVDEASVKEARNYTLLVLIVAVMGGMTLMFLPPLPGLNQAEWFQRCFYEFMNGFTSEGMSMMDYVGYKAAHPLAYNGFIWVETMAMFFGRLEILPIIFALWRFIIDPIRDMRLKSKKARPSME